jgi:myxalamid-type polyketide synthase MxaB
MIMVDTPLPAVFEGVDLSDDAKFFVDLIEFTNYFAGTSMEISYDELRGLSEEEAIASVHGLVIEHGVLPAKTTHEYLHRLIAVCKQHVQILQGYQPQPCEIPVHMLRPEDTGMLTEATGQAHADDLGWGDLVQLRLHQVPGHHFTMMTGENAVSIAATIDQLIRNEVLVGFDVKEPASLGRTSTNR